MTKHYLFFIVLSITTLCCSAQQEIPQDIKQKFRRIVKLIREDSIIELSRMVSYPVRCDNPIPDIVSPHEFILYYPTLVDPAFKKILATYDDSVIFEHHVGYGLVGGAFSGDIWIDYSGDTILSFNYSSQAQQQLIQKLNAEEQTMTHSSVNKWTISVAVCKAANTIIRVDEVGDDLRYAAWTHGQKVSEKPDLVLYKGVMQPQGDIGGWTYTFTNGKWSYVLDDAEACEEAQDCGLFLKVLFDGKEKSSMRMQMLKSAVH